MEARDAELVDAVVADDISEEEAVDQAQIEGDACEHVSEEGRVTVEEAEDFSSLDEEEISALDELVRAEDEFRSIQTEARALTPAKFLQPGGEWGGSEAPVRRAIRIATDNRLTVTSPSGRSSAPAPIITSARRWRSPLTCRTARAPPRRWTRPPARSPWRSATRAGAGAC